MKKNCFASLYITIPNRCYGKKNGSISKVLICRLIEKKSPVDGSVRLNRAWEKCGNWLCCLRFPLLPHDGSIEMEILKQRLYCSFTLHLRNEQLLDKKRTVFDFCRSTPASDFEQRTAFCLQRQKCFGQRNVRHAVQKCFPQAAISCGTHCLHRQGRFAV